MTEKSPFDHRPDAELGAVLRDALTAPDDDESFARRVVAAAEPLLGSQRGEWWEMLVRWARPELAAASLVLIAGAVIWFSVLSGRPNTQSILGDPLRDAGEQLGLPGLFADEPRPNVDELLAVALGN